jgi:hypothetical protein
VCQWSFHPLIVGEIIRVYQSSHKFSSLNVVPASPSVSTAMNGGRGPLEASHFQTSSPIAEQGVHVSLFALGMACLFTSVSRITGNSVQSLPGMDGAALRARWTTAALAVPYASIDGVEERDALADVSTNRLGSERDQITLWMILKDQTILLPIALQALMIAHSASTSSQNRQIMALNLHLHLSIHQQH